MQYPVKRTCGHVETLRLFGPGNERERQLSYEATRACLDCYRAQQVAASASIVEPAGLPALVGTEKQVAWATTIRVSLLAKVDEFLAYFETQAAAHPEQADVIVTQRGIAERALKNLRSQKYASWWIDNRGVSGRTLLAESADPADQPTSVGAQR